jgi:hypothetical protein
MDYCEQLAAEEEKGRSVPSPSFRLRVPPSLLVAINSLVGAPGTPFMDRNEVVRALIVDGFRYRAAADREGV